MYTFRKIKKEEIPLMYSLIESRINWMNEVGIKQWNVTDYTKRFPLSYYEEAYLNDQVFVLYDEENDEIVCAATLFEDDFRWEDKTPAIYIHNLVSKVGGIKVGGILIRHAEEYARSKGKVYLRLDSAVDNFKLDEYYKNLGFNAVGRCQHGKYLGTLRQKKI